MSWRVLGIVMAAGLATSAHAAEPGPGASASPAPPVAVGGPEGHLRHITDHLIADLADATAEPAFDTNDQRELCLQHSIESPFRNPYSPLPKWLARRHQRITLAGKPAARVEMRDAFLLDLPRAMTFQVTPAEEPRLEFAYHVLHCGDVPRRLRVRIRGEDASGAFERVVPLSVTTPLPDGERFRSVSVDLPFAAGEPAQLTVSFETGDPDDAAASDNRGKPGGKKSKRGGGSRVGQMAWIEPVITGRDPGPRGAQDTNVLWIVIDAVRTDALGPSRSFDTGGQPFTPNLDAVMAGGTSFTSAYSMANQTRTSTTAMLCSVHPSIGGFHSHSWAFAEGRLAKFYESKPPLITRLLDEAGWRVVHLGNNFFLWGNLIYGIDHGFPRAIDHRAVPADAPATTAEAIDWFDTHRDERWFMMLNYTAPHTPYKPPPEYLEKALALPGGKMLGQFLPRTYLGELMWVDANLGPVLAKLDALGLSDDTVIIVTADHGEVMNPAHACFSAIVGQPCAYNHSLTVYDDELRVPLSLTLPGRIAGGHVVQTPVSHADLAPTLLDLLGLPPDPGMEGESLRPALEGGEPAARPIYADGRLASAFRLGDWKLIQHAEQDDVAPRTRMAKEADMPRQELFDLVHDPHEMHNAVYEQPEIAKTLTAELGKVRRRFVAALRRELPRPAGETATAGAGGTGGPETSAPESTHADNHVRLAGDDGVHRARVIVRSALGPGGTGGTAGVKVTLTCLGSGCEALPDGALQLTLEAAPTPATAATSAMPTTAPAPKDTASFRVAPWGAALEVTTTVDDAPLPLEHLRLGRWGIALLAPGEHLDSAERWALAASPTAPYPQPHETALYWWRSAYVPPTPRLGTGPGGAAPPPDSGDVAAPEDDASQDLKNDEHLSGEVRKVLKDLGYTH